MLRDLENAFHRLLPTQYHCIQSMMVKGIWKDLLTTTSEQEILERQWDWYAFFTFIQQYRLQNSHNFVWFSLINAASHFAGGRAHIPLHFGYSIAKNTMLRKLNEINMYTEIVMKSKWMLNWFNSFIVTIFDNSQFNIMKEFQWNATSSNMAEATCRIFLKPMMFEYLKNIADNWAGMDPIRITYLHQMIPLPYGMPAFESLPADWKISDLADDNFSTFEESMDLSGQRVERYYEVKRTMSVTRCPKRILPYSSSNLFQFSITCHNDSLFTLSVCEKLKSNWQRTVPSETADVHCSWYHHILKLSYSMTKVWRGQPSPAQLLIPAVSPKNKTTNKGTANVVMSLLLYHGIVEPTSNEGAMGILRAWN